MIGLERIGLLMKKIIRLVSLLLTAALTACLLFGCALPSPVPADDSATAQNEEAYDDVGTIDSAPLISVTDMTGNVINMDAFASRIVVLDAADCEILFAIGAGEQVVGRVEECDYPEAAGTIPYVTAGGLIDSDLILAQNPQVVVMTAEQAQDSGLLTTLRDAEVQTIVTNVTDFNDLYSAITLLGAIADRVAEAGSLVANLLTAFAAIQSQTDGGNEKTVYFELSPLADGLQTAGSGTLLNSVALLLGLRNEFEDLEGYVDLTAEDVINRSPDIIVTIAPDAADGTTAADEILARPGWESVHAVVSKSVYAVDGASLLRSGPRLIDAVQALYTSIYGEAVE
jgi:iron complex transport system substrate-binding protein